MIDDPLLKAYQDLDQPKKDFLASYTPSLSALLHRHVNAHRTPVRCVVGLTVCGRQATGRQTLNGTPACAHHGGTHPLDLVNPDTWESSS